MTQTPTPGSDDGPRPRPLFLGGERLRQQFERPSGGGGEKFMPYTLDESIRRLGPQIDTLVGQVEAIPPFRRGDQVIVEARLHPQFLAPSSFPAQLLSYINATPVGSRMTLTSRRNKDGTLTPGIPTKSIYLATAASSARALRGVLSQPTGRGLSNKLREGIQTLDEISLSVASTAQESPEASTDTESVALPMWEAVLHGRVDNRGQLQAASSAALDRWFTYITEIGGQPQTEWVRRTDALTFSPIRIAPDLLEEAAAFNGLRAIHPMPRVRHLPDAQPARETFTLLGTPPPTTQDTPLRVAVFDGGVDATQPVWADRVTSYTVGAIAADPASQRHGALVTSALLYGHLDQNTLPEPANMVIDHYTTVPQSGHVPSLQAYWLLDTIERQVKANDYDVVALCVAPHKVVDDNHVDRWTSTIDALSHEENVLFVVAGGNNGEDPEQLNRILIPADASNALAIGAAATHGPRSVRAPYSAIGPGRPAAQIRPSGIAFGGTHDNPFIATDNDAHKLTFAGTSCAAPLVVHGLADLSDRIGRDNVDAVTLRAFAIHFAEPCKASETPHHVGHGHIRHNYDIINNTTVNSAHILYRGQIDRSEFIPLAIPMPPGVTGWIKLRYTVTTSTRVAGSDPVDYTLAGIETVLRPNSRKLRFSKGRRSRDVDVRLNQDLVAKLLADGWTPSGEPVTLNLDKRPRLEATLRAEGKWDSVRVGQRRFQDANSFYEPRIELSHLAREGGMLTSANVPELDWSLLVTLEAQPGINLHEQVRSNFPVLNTLPVPAVTIGTRSA